VDAITLSIIQQTKTLQLAHETGAIAATANNVITKNDYNHRTGFGKEHNLTSYA